MTELDYKLLPGIVQTGLAGISTAHIVGGTARDLYLGLKPKDYDITVFENPVDSARQIAEKTGGRLITMGKPGKIVYRVVAGGHVMDVTPARGPTIEMDLAGRDFTMNAMAFDMASGRLIDPLNGRRDIREKRVRSASPVAFSEDPLRLLRAYRMEAVFGFSIDPTTRALISQFCRLIGRSAGERVRDELFNILSAPNAHAYVLQMRESGLLFAVFPELLPLSGCTQNRHHSYDVLDHTLVALEHLESLISPYESGIRAFPEPLDPSRVILLKVAILLHDIGKPACRSVDATGAVHFYGHETAGAKGANAICDRLRCANDERRFITDIIAHHVRPLLLYQALQKKTLTDRAVTRFFMACGDDTPYLLLHAAADLFGKGAACRDELAPLTAFLHSLAETFFADFKKRSASAPLLTGRDLISIFGLPPSPLFKQILDQVETARLSGACTSREAAVLLVKDQLLRRATRNKT